MMLTPKFRNCLPHVRGLHMLSKDSIEGRYAEALFSAAKKKSAAKDVGLFLQKLEFRKPQGPDTDTVTLGSKGIQSLLYAQEENVRGCVAGLLGVLASNGRLTYLDRICKYYENLINQEAGKLSVLVQLARQPSPYQTEKITDVVQQLFPKKLSLSLNFQVCPEILGGFILEFEGVTIDLSASTRVERLIAAISKD